MSAQIEFFTASQLLFWILFLFPLRRPALEASHGSHNNQSLRYEYITQSQTTLPCSSHCTGAHPLVHQGMWCTATLSGCTLAWSLRNQSWHVWGVLKKLTQKISSRARFSWLCEYLKPMDCGKQKPLLVRTPEKQKSRSTPSLSS